MGAGHDGRSLLEWKDDFRRLASVAREATEMSPRSDIVRQVVADDKGNRIDFLSLFNAALMEHYRWGCPFWAFHNCLRVNLHFCGCASILSDSSCHPKG
jgi:hypothetical protein